VPLEDFFSKFYYKIFGQTCPNHAKIRIANFLKGRHILTFFYCSRYDSRFFAKTENFPDFDILFDETGQISAQDYIYIFSLLLYYSCVTQENEFFQKCCSALNSKFQLGILSFFEYFNISTKFDKESLRSAIKQGVMILSPQKSSSSIFTIISSPFKTPKKSDRHNTPPTPSKEFVCQKLKELKAVKTQLETEKFEKSMMEVEMRQSQEKIEHLGKP
jgi:hypothetical protein